MCPRDEDARFGCACDLIHDVEREVLKDIAQEVRELGAYSTFGPDGSLDGADVVLRSDVLSLFPVLPARAKNEEPSDG